MSVLAPTATSPAAPCDTGRTSAARAGALTMLPLTLGYLPFALVIGAVVAQHGAPLAGWAGSWLIYGGSAHLATIRALDKAGPAVAILTGLVINTRLVVYSASLARHWVGQPRWFRFAAAGLIIDPTWAAGERHAEGCGDLREQRRFFIAAGLVLGVVWSTAIAVGVIVGARLEWLDVNIVIPLCLIALVGPGLRKHSERGVIVAAASTAVLTRNFPAGTGLLLAIAAGAIVGSVSRREDVVMTWLVILAVGAGSFLFRVGPLLLLERRPLGPTGERVIRHAGLAAISVLVALSTTHSAAGGNALPTLVAVAVGLTVAVRGQAMLKIVLFGGAAYAAATLAIHLITH